MTWIVSSVIENPVGLCLDADNGYEAIDYKPYVRFLDERTNRGMISFNIYPGIEAENGARSWRYRISISLWNIARNYIRRTYDLPEDTFVGINFPGYQDSSFQGQDREFDTEAEALEFANNINDLNSVGTQRDERVLFSAEFSQVIDGVLVERNVFIRHSGETVTLYTIDDIFNYWTTTLGAPRSDLTIEYAYRDIEGGTGQLEGEEALAFWPESGCTPRSVVSIVNTEGGPGNTILIDPDFTPQTLDPDNVTVTIIDGDPPLTELENGPGSVTISDSGNINMRNDGGTFFLNEFGNVGFYASGDASLTAESQVQLGSGGTTFNVDSNGLNMRDSTGTVSFTADELTRLKALLD